MNINPNSPWYKKPTSDAEEQKPSFEEAVPAIEQMAHSLITEVKLVDEIHTNKGLRMTATSRNLRYAIIARTDPFAIIEKAIQPVDSQKAKSIFQRQRDCIDVVEAAASLKKLIEDNLERFYQLFLLADAEGIMEFGIVKIDSIKSKIDALAKQQDLLPKPETTAKTAVKSSSPWANAELKS